MRRLSIFAVLSLSLVWTAAALGQADEGPNSGPGSSTSQLKEIPEDPRPQPSAGRQCRHQAHCPGLPPCCRCPPRPSHPPSWFEPEPGHHAALGALVGFTLLGVAGGMGAQTDPRAKVAAGLFTGSLGALIGAGVGHLIPANQRRHRYHRYPLPQEEEMAKNRTRFAEFSAKGTP